MTEQETMDKFFNVKTLFSDDQLKEIECTIDFYYETIQELLILNESNDELLHKILNDINMLMDSII